MSKRSEAGLDLAFRVFNEIGIIAHLSATEFERVLPDNLSLAGFTVLNHFVRLGREAAAPARLARNLQVTKGAMTNTIQRLEAEGFVTLEPDPEDGRGKIVRITKAGRAAREAALRTLAPSLQDLSATFPASKLAAIAPLLSELRAIMDARRD